MIISDKQMKDLIKSFPQDYNKYKLSVTPLDHQNRALPARKINLRYKFEGFEDAPIITFLKLSVNDDVPNSEYILLEPTLPDKLSADQLIEVYNLTNRRYQTQNTKTPNFIDIPKNVGNSYNDTLLITPALNGESIIITDHDSNHYRVYYDTRENSSVLYEKVVFALDAIDYKYNYNPDTDLFEPKQQQYIRCFLSFSQKMLQGVKPTAKKWKPFIYHEVGSNNKPYRTEYKKHTANFLGEVPYLDEKLKERFTNFTNKKLEQLKYEALRHNSKIKLKSNGTELPLPTTPPESWTYQEIQGLVRACYEAEDQRANKAKLSDASASAEKNANVKLFTDVQLVNEMTKLLAEKKTGGFSAVVTTIDSAAALHLAENLTNKEERYKALVDYYFKIGDQKFIQGYASPQGVLLAKYVAFDCAQLENELAKPSNTAVKKGELMRLIGLLRILEYSDIVSDLPTITNRNFPVDAFSQVIPFVQNNFARRIQLNKGVTSLGVCHALSFLKAFSNRADLPDTFINYLTSVEPFDNHKGIAGGDSFFFNKFIEKLQIAQHKEPFALSRKLLTPQALAQQFQNKVLKSVILANENHATSLCRVPTSGNEEYFEFFDPNKGQATSGDLPTIMALIKQILPEMSATNSYLVTEVSESEQKNNYIGLNLLVDGVSVIDLLYRMKQRLPLHPDPISSASSLLLSLGSPRVKQKRILAPIAGGMNFATSMLALSKAFGEHLPILSSLSKEKNVCSIKAITNTGELSQKTITEADYNAIKFFNDTIKDLHVQGITWDNKLGKFIGVDKINYFNDKSSKAFAFISLVRFVNDRIAGQALFDVQNSELRDFILTQTAVDLITEGIDVGTELVAPSINYAKLYLSGTGFKSMLGANFLKGASLGLGGLGLGLSIVSLGLSIKILSEIDPELHPYAYKVALVNTGFAGIGVLLSTFSFALMCLGFLTLAAVLGAVGAVVGIFGLLTGVLSFKSTKATGVIDVINVLRSIEHYRTKPIFENQNDILMPANLPIVSINYNDGTLGYGKYLIKQKEKVVINNNALLSGLEVSTNQTAPVDMLEQFEITALNSFKKLKRQSIVFLPATPELTFDYSYEKKPENMSEEDMSIGNKLDAHGLEYNMIDSRHKMDHVISELIPEVQSTNINVILALKNKVVIVPALNNNEEQGIVTYEKISTNVTPNEEHKELYFYMGEHSNLKIEATSQKIKYTFDVSSSDVTKTTKKHTMSKVSDGVYMFNETIKLTLDINSLETNSFIVKDNYEEYIYNVATDQKTTLVMDALNLTPAEALAKASTLTLNAPQILVKRMSATNNDISTGVYIKKQEKIIADANPRYLIGLSLTHHISGGYYSEEAQLVYFYSYKKSLIWAIDQSGKLQHMFSLASLDTEDNKGVFFFQPTHYEYKLISVTPVNGGVVAKYIQHPNDLGLPCRELSVLCNEEGMNLIQSTVFDGDIGLQDNSPLSDLFDRLRKKETLLIDFNDEQKDVILNNLVTGYITNLEESLEYEESPISQYNRSLADRCALAEFSVSKFNFFNLFFNYVVNVETEKTSFVATRKTYLGTFNALETFFNEDSEQDEELCFSIIDTKENLDIVKPLCAEPLGVTLLGEHKGNYFFYAPKNKGTIYLQDGSGSGKDVTGIHFVIQNFSDTYLDVRLVDGKLLLTTTDGSLVSYDCENQQYTLLISNNASFTKDNVPTRETLKATYPSYDLADLVLLNAITLEESFDDEAPKKVYSYFNTHLILNQNYEILNIAQDDNNKNILYIWYVSKDKEDCILLKRAKVNLNNTTYSETDITKNTVTMYDNIEPDYNEVGFKIFNNIYRFIPNKKGVEIVNSKIKYNPIDDEVAQSNLVSGFVKKMKVFELESFVINKKRIPVANAAHQKALKPIGEVDGEVFFLNKQDNRIMVAKPSDAYKGINYQHTQNTTNLFEDIYKENNTAIYSIKNNSSAPNKLHLDTSYVGCCNTLYLANASNTLDIKFEQNYMNQVKSTYIDDKNIKKLILEFPDSFNLLVSIHEDTFTIHDSLSDFKLILVDILKPKTSDELGRKNIDLKVATEPVTSDTSVLIHYSLELIVNKLLKGNASDTKTFKRSKLGELFRETIN